MKVSALLAATLSVCVAATSIRPHELRIIRNSSTLSCASASIHHNVQKHRGLNDIAGHYVTEKTPANDLGEEYLRVFAYDEGTLRGQVAILCADQAEGLLAQSRVFERQTSSPVPLEIKPLLEDPGEPSNRVDLVFFGDGYTLAEGQKFFDDAERLARDIAGNQTFSTVRPLLNFWAAFTPSSESGIGVGGVPKNTPFGLYRDGTELRGVYYSKPDIATAACASMGDQCDYPILLGNDPYYGGLGGRFTVVTSSTLNGPSVLRHELGHSIIRVGEEYDGGASYFGVNSAGRTTTVAPWAHWLSTNVTRVERSAMPYQRYIWALLNATTPWSTTYTASGAYSRSIMRFSLAGFPSAGIVTLALDGKDLGWTGPPPGLGLDRWHYDIPINRRLAAGVHTITVTLHDAKYEGTAQLCNMEIMDFGTEQEFVSKPNHYSLYPTYSDRNATTYRPTDSSCLMRIMSSPNLCKVCVEGLWTSLLRRVDLIDDLTESCVWNASKNKFDHYLTLSPVPVAEYRDGDVATEESYSIVWQKNGLVVSGERGVRLELDANATGNYYSVGVDFQTEEVRKREEGIFVSTREIVVKGCR